MADKEELIEQLINEMKEQAQNILNKEEYSEIVQDAQIIVDDNRNHENETKSDSDSQEEKINTEQKNQDNKKIKVGPAKKGQIVTAESLLPSELPIISFQGHPIFPGVFTPLMINVSEDIELVEKAIKKDGHIGIIMQKDDASAEHVTSNELYKVGTAARIIKKINLPDGGINVFISTLKRFKIKKVLHSTSPIQAFVDYLEDEEDDTFEVKALTRALVSEMKEVAENNPLFSDEMRLNMININNPGKIADFIASILNIEGKEQQRILEILNVRQRIEQVLVFIKKEQELLRIQKKIQNELNERVEKNQREYFLREEMKSIQDELGVNADGNISEYRKFKEKIEAFHFEGEVKETVESELGKFQLLDTHDPDYSVSRNYLELVTLLPWNDEISEDYNIGEANKILQSDHYGLDDVKKRIIEYISVRKMKQDSKGSILILVGPPGVGKTSVGRSIASAMKKPFYRFSVGGMHDESEIRGHRRTYIGAMCGKIIQGLKLTKSKSPVFMIDEVDKMGSGGAHGDPASALLEVLDPEQNVSFRDNYLDLPFDVSNVFFILTANTLDSIPEPLLDRAEIIQLSGYIDQEKFEIAKKYLIPKNLEKNGLKKGQVKYSKDALKRIAQEYAREAGVRNFEKCLDKIHRKLVTQMITEGEVRFNEAVKKAKESGKTKEEISLLAPSAYMDLEKDFLIEYGDIEKYLGKPVFDESLIKTASVPGTAIGLAWTSMGGDTLLIESVSFPDKGNFVLTGQMGDVMKESASIAMNWVRRYVIEKGIKDAQWFEKNSIHLHIPEGATPKDGPSAGITMATTLVSLLSDKVIKPHLAMTGELSLTGQVLPIGGLREKTVAAKRNKIKTILIPKANERDLEEIPSHVKQGITFVPVCHVEEVIDFVFSK